MWTINYRKLVNTNTHDQEPYWLFGCQSIESNNLKFITDWMHEHKNYIQDGYIQILSVEYSHP